MNRIQLHKRLKEFGLDPSQWKIELNKSNAHVRHRRDNKVYFEGKVSKVCSGKGFQWTWQNLSLVV